MVAAPLSTVDLPIDLPTSTATPQKKPDKPTYVSIKPDLAVAIGENMVKRVDLVRSLDTMPNITKDSYIFLRADRAVPYGDLMDVLEILRAGGYSKIKLVALEGVPDAAVAAAPQQALTGHRRATTVPAALGFVRGHRARAPSRWCGAGDRSHCKPKRPTMSSARRRSRSDSIWPRLHREVTDLPPGPDTDASVASPRLPSRRPRSKGNRSAAGHADGDRRSRPDRHRDQLEKADR